MPELPDILNYVRALEHFVQGHELQSVDVRSPFVLRTFEPALADCHGHTVVGIRRLGKRLVLELTDDLFVVIHLMIGGRLNWKKAQTRPTRKSDLAALHFSGGTLLLTEARPKKRASIHVVREESGLRQHDRGGLSVLDATLEQFQDRLNVRNRTLKRCLTDPATFDGIGNAYSDEILHAARLSPLKQTRQLSQEQVVRLFEATRDVLTGWTNKLAAESGNQFPRKVTAFHPDMAVHGKFQAPCPVCGTPVQRIVLTEREFNYCPACQTNGKLLKDRSLSRLLKDDWPNRVSGE